MCVSGDFFEAVESGKMRVEVLTVKMIISNPDTKIAGRWKELRDKLTVPKNLYMQSSFIFRNSSAIDEGKMVQ